MTDSGESYTVSDPGQPNGAPEEPVVEDPSRPGILYKRKKVTDAAYLAKIIVWTFAGSVGLSCILTGILFFRPVRVIEGPVTIVKSEAETSDEFTLPSEGNDEEIQVSAGGSANVKLYTYDSSDAFELFKTVSSIMAGPLGFVLGFYFRDSAE